MKGLGNRKNEDIQEEGTHHLRLSIYDFLPTLHPMSKKLKLISWNVNGLRACIKKGFPYFATWCEANFLCLQETKVNPGTIPEENFSFGWKTFHSAIKKGYSGTAIFAQDEPIAVQEDFPPEAHIGEGRAITVETEDFFLVNTYVPNAQGALARLPYRMEWDRDLRAYLQLLDKRKPVILCGDLNVAHEEIDIARPDSNHFSPGFSDEERDGMSQLLSAGFTDTFRHLHPDEPHYYSWWSYRAGARERNVGWRLDYFVISDRLVPALEDAFILKDVMGSDHCPVGITLDLGKL